MGKNHITPEKRSGLETIYNYHHAKRGNSFVILGNERGSFLKTQVGTGKRVLDIGCRDGALTSYYAKGNTVLGCDIDSEALARARDNIQIETKHVDLNGDWGVPQGGFEAVVAAEVVEHLYYPDIVAKKVASALKTGGVFVGTVPYAFSFPNRIKILLGMKRGTPFEDPTHINHFTLREFRGILDKEFTDVKIVGLVPPRYRLIARIFPFAFAHDLLFCARKK